jgi:hypothetical protein
MWRAPSIQIGVAELELQNNPLSYIETLSRIYEVVSLGGYLPVLAASHTRLKKLRYSFQAGHEILRIYIATNAAIYTKRSYKMHSKLH